MENSAQEAFENIEPSGGLHLRILKRRGGSGAETFREIFQGLADWQKERTDLEKNIADARRTFPVIWKNMSSQWEDHSRVLLIWL